MKKISLIKSLGVILTITLTSWISANAQNPSDSKSVIIGNQAWLTENLNVDKFHNGDPIVEAKTIEDWKEAGAMGIARFCYYDFDPANGPKYGKLYNWYAVYDRRGLAPEGWHIPSDAEWTELEDFLGKSSRSKMQCVSDWGSGTNESGFNAFPGGWIGLDNFFGYFGFQDILEQGYWWSSTEVDFSKSWNRYLSTSQVLVQKSIQPKENGYSVRCLRD